MLAVTLLVKKCHHLIGNRTCHYRVHTFSTKVPTNVRFQMVKPDDANDSSLKLCIFSLFKDAFSTVYLVWYLMEGRKE